GAARAGGGEEAVGRAGGDDEQGPGPAVGRVGEGVGGVARGVRVVDLEQVLAVVLAQAREARGLEGGAPGEELAASRAEGTQCRVSVVVGLALEAEAYDSGVAAD